MKQLNGLGLLIKKRGIKFSRVADALNIKRESVNHAVHTNLNTLTSNSLKKYAKVLRLTPGDLLDKSLALEGLKDLTPGQVLNIKLGIKKKRATGNMIIYRASKNRVYSQGQETPIYADEDYYLYRQVWHSTTRDKPYMTNETLTKIVSDQWLKEHHSWYGCRVLNDYYIKKESLTEYDLFKKDLFNTL